jgi:uncharacterized protein DUF4383
MEAQALRSEFAEWSFAQKGDLVLIVVMLAFGTVGLAINPDFATGDAATSETFLWVDWNGWHAVATYALALPGLYLMLRPTWAVFYALYAGSVLVLTGIWAFLDDNPATLLPFQHQVGDGVLHMTLGILFLVLATVQIGRDRRGAAISAA